MQAAAVNDLHELLDQGLQYPPEYAEGLSNHLPMALHALQAMGADPPRLRRFAAGYAARFGDRRADPPAAPVNDWTAWLGRAYAFEPLRATFARLLDHEGEAAALRRVLPALWPGAAAAAFHGLIRSAHAFEAGHRAELAAGLAYWGWRWQPLPPTPLPADGGLAFEHWAEQLVAAAAQQHPDGRLISHRIAQVSQGGAYRRLAGALRPADRRLALLAGFAVERYLATRNFTVLHIVTGLRAARVLCAVASPDEGSVDALLRAVSAAYLSTGIRAPPAARAPAPPPAWEDLLAMAVAADDDHVVKLVHACRQEEGAYGGAAYRRAAALALA